MHSEDCAHACLHAFGVVNAGAVPVAKEVADAEPVGDAEYGPEVAGVLYAVENQGQGACHFVRVVGMVRDFCQCHDVGQGLKVGDGFHAFFICFQDLGFSQEVPVGLYPFGISDDGVDSQWGTEKFCH